MNFIGKRVEVGKRIDSEYYCACLDNVVHTKEGYSHSYYNRNQLSLQYSTFLYIAT